MKCPVGFRRDFSCGAVAAYRFPARILLRVCEFRNGGTADYAEYSGLARSEKQTLIFNMVASVMVKELGMSLVTEDIETREQLVPG